MSTANEALVAAQFGPRARAYVESADHARGPDLARLDAIAAARPGARILDLGCGGGHVTYTVARHAASVVAYDLSTEMLETVAAEARSRGLRNVETRRGVAEDLPFADASFDLVLSRYSAHHWWDIAAGLAGMRRVMKPDGLAVIVDTAAPEDAQRHDTFLQAIEIMRDPSHVRDHTPTRWVALLRDAGFEPATPVMGRLRVDFAAWVARIGTPPTMAQAIRLLQSQMPADVRARLAVEPDGSFTYDTALIEARPA